MDTLFVSSQHTDVVHWFSVNDFKPLQLPPDFFRSYYAINNINTSFMSPHQYHYYNGTFMQFGIPGKHKDSELVYSTK